MISTSKKRKMTLMNLCIKLKETLFAARTIVICPKGISHLETTAVQTFLRLDMKTTAVIRSMKQTSR